MATIYGTAGKDNLRGTRKADAIYGLQDDDLIRGGQGRDFLYGGLNSDTLDGGVGHDVLFGDGGRDWLLGGWGNDVLFGGGGNDWLSDGGGNDMIDAFTSSTTVPEPATGFADQTLVGGAGDDTLSAGVSYVTMSGGSGEDEFWFTGSGAAHNAPQATITDYEAGETLRVINIPGLIFAGETDAPGLMEFGYHREGSDTVIEANTGPDTSEPLNIRLIGYTGPITADDFILS